MSEIKIIKNCLPEKDFESIKNTIYSDYFQWYLNFGVNHKKDGFVQFTHTFYHNYTKHSDWFDSLKPLIQILNPLSFIRIKANLLVKTNQIIEHGMHTDQPFKCSTAIFYLNNNDGYTKFENGKIISSEENKLVIFDNFLKHSGSTCTDTNERIVINFNYIEKLI